jgi:hypothetical protein
MKALGEITVKSIKIDEAKQELPFSGQHWMLCISCEVEC